MPSRQTGPNFKTNIWPFLKLISDQWGNVINTHCCNSVILENYCIILSLGPPYIIRVKEMLLNLLFCVFAVVINIWLYQSVVNICSKNSVKCVYKTQLTKEKILLLYGHSTKAILRDYATTLKYLIKHWSHLLWSKF